MLCKIKLKHDETKDDLANESHQRETVEYINKIQCQISKQRKVGWSRSLGKWMVHVVIVCELLVSGTPPTTASTVMQTMSTNIRGEELLEASPLVNFMRECRTVAQNSEMLVAMHLGNTNIWHHLFMDGTSRRQTKFQNLIISLMEDKTLDPVIVLPCIWMDNGTAENQIKSVMEKVSWNVTSAKKHTLLRHFATHT